MRKLLLNFIDEKQLVGDSISEIFMHQKVLEIYSDLVMKISDTGTKSNTFEFKESKEELKPKWHSQCGQVLI